MTSVGDMDNSTVVSRAGPRGELILVLEDAAGFGAPDLVWGVGCANCCCLLDELLALVVRLDDLICGGVGETRRS